MSISLTAFSSSDFISDGADLLNLTQQYSVHLSFNSDPLSLKVQGLRGDVKRMDVHMKNFEEVSFLILLLGQ